MRTVGAGAGFAGDRIDPAVALATSGLCDAVVLECLAERTLVAALRARRADSDAGADPRLRRRLTPLLGPARRSGSRIISNLGAANPAAAARAIVALARELGLSGLRVAAVVGDDVLPLAGEIAWTEKIEGTLLGAHAYLGADALAPAIEAGADVIVTGRTADSALFAAEIVPILDGRETALAGALTVGHLLECGGQVSGGNFKGPDGESLSAAALASLGYPLATVRPDGSAELFLLEGAPGRLDRLTATLQLLYEVHDPARYITPDLILDFTGIRIEETGRNRVRVSGAAAQGRPEALKVSGFVERPGMIADVEIGFAGTGAEARAACRRCASASARRPPGRGCQDRSGRDRFDSRRAQRRQCGACRMPRPRLCPMPRCGGGAGDRGRGLCSHALRPRGRGRAQERASPAP